MDQYRPFFMRRSFIILKSLSPFPRSLQIKLIFLIAILTSIFPLTALAADKINHSSEIIFFLQIVSLILIGRLLGEIMQRMGQPSVMGELLGGIVLGSSFFGVLWPTGYATLFPDIPAQKEMLNAVASLGVLLLLLVTGMETDLKLIRKTGYASILISLTGVSLPFLSGVTFAYFLPDTFFSDPNQRIITSLFIGTALSISSIKIVAVVVREMNFARRDIGQIIFTSAVIEDSIGWIAISFIFSLASYGKIDIISILQTLVGIILFLIVSLTIGRRLTTISIRWSNDNLQSEAAVISIITVFMIVMAVTTQLLGVHTILGAFIAGVLIGDSPILTRKISQQLRGFIAGIFAPVFFGLAGLNADLSFLKDPGNLLLTIGFIALASIGKASGAFIGGKLSGLTLRESTAIACGMNARGSTEIIIATIGLSMGILSQDMYTMIVAMAFTTTLAMPPLLRWSLARIPLHDEEKKRLEREEFEATSFIRNIERILLAVDDSPNGRFASHLAGIIAGSRKMATTVFHMDESLRGPRELEIDLKNSLQQIDSSENALPADLQIISKNKDVEAKDAISHEASKGYDLLIIGMSQTTTPKGNFTDQVNRVATGFDGQIIVVRAGDEHLADPLSSQYRILTPITGTEVSRRATEFAVIIAQTVKAPVSALHVTTRRRKKNASKTSMLHSRKAILQEFETLASLYEIDARTITREDSAPEKAILDIEHEENINLIMLGVNRRPGKKLFFGVIPAALAEHSHASILFVSGQLRPSPE